MRVKRNPPGIEKTDNDLNKARTTRDFSSKPSGPESKLSQMKQSNMRCATSVGLLIQWAALCGFGFVAWAQPVQYPIARPSRTTPVASEGKYTVHPGKPKQIIKGIGFEIQSDSIGGGKAQLPEATTSVPHDLTPSERQRFYSEMLKGFRYCRLAGGLYWRGLDAEQKNFQGRWPEQMAELRELFKASGVEGVSLEYWSPAPFWKANGKLEGRGVENRLRCFRADFENDPVYHGDQAQFLRDFAAACRRDLEYLRKQGIPIMFWGLQNEPHVDQTYSSCRYTPEQYALTFKAVAPQIRAFDPAISIIADASWNLSFIAPVLKEPDGARWVDALVMHHVGSDSKKVRPRSQMKLATDLPAKPLFQNEYEYLGGPTSPARCLNTVQHIMNWFQLGEAPTWFWLHALKPVHNGEASGFALGFWTPLVGSVNPKASPVSPLPAPGHWTWNPYNWHAVGSFIRHLPWDCQAVAVDETERDDDLRIFAFKRPKGKLTIVLSNRSGAAHTFNVATGLAKASFRGFRYTPDNAGADFRGVLIDVLRGPTISPRLSDLTWEFWEEL